MHSKASRLAAAVAATLLVAAPGGALAQSDTDPVPEAALDKYVAAYLEIQAVSEEYRKAASETDGQEEMEEMRAAYRQELTETVKNSGLSVERYNEIHKAIQERPDLRERARRKLTERAEGGG